MRIRVHFCAPPPIVIPLNYAHQLASVVYHLLDRSSPAYATFLHGQGYGAGDLRFKLFTFSPLLGHPRQVVAGHLRVETGAVSCTARLRWKLSFNMRSRVFSAAIEST